MPRGMLHLDSPLRIFGLSALLTTGSIIAVGVSLGRNALAITLVLIAVEVAFSFDNAIINAKILAKMTPFWQRMFLTAGAVVAIFGMRIVFPLLIVVATTDLGWGRVVDLALHHPGQYATALDKAHPSIAAFGGAFLMVLALDFFADDTRQVLWLTRLERNLSRLATHWAPPLVTAMLVTAVAFLPFNNYTRTTLLAGFMGIIVYSALHGFTEILGRVQSKQPRGAHYTGLMALMSLVYLEVLDASFSFDGVIGAFAVTNKVVVIAIGLGIGALWVRSLTIFMVRRGTLSSYRYIDHGAHYTILTLACLLLASTIYDVPEVVVGLLGIGIIASSLIASRQAKNQ